MFAPSYAPSYISAYQRDPTSPRDRYVSALSRVQQAEMEYVAYLAQQERAKLAQQEHAKLVQQERAKLVQQERARLAQQARAKLVQQQRNEQARAVAVKTLQTFVLHAAVSSLLNGQASYDGPQPQGRRAPFAHPDVAKPISSRDEQSQLQRRNRVRIVRPQEAPVERPVLAVRDALKRRLASEPNVEVHATIHRLLADLSAPPKHVDQAPAVPRSLAAVQHLDRAFRRLASEFAFPPQLDFTPAPTELSSAYPAAKLPYTPRNAPVRHFEHALNDLLSQLDAVDSEGDANVRSERKRVVGMVEKALADLDRIVEGRWKLQDTRARAPREDAWPVASTSASVPAAPSLSAGLGDHPSSETESSQEPQLPLVGAVPEINGSQGASEEESFETPSPLLAAPSSSVELGDRSSSEAEPSQEPQLPLVDAVLAVNEEQEEESFETPHREIESQVGIPTPSSPPSLSFVTALPDEDKDDSDSSWSEIEDSL
ncbi:hypothetical protein C8R44DRAFT_780429 [Mycena epipterygia]|nr:hypothetical protein C8R44DRAFT_780429 [Mycena epipterygia]